MGGEEQITYANPQNAQRQTKAMPDKRRPPLERIAGKYKDLEMKSITLQNEKGELRKLVGWVERDADALERVVSIVRQHGGHAGKIYDRRYGFGVGPIWFGDGFRIDDCQFYFDGNLPVIRLGEHYTGLNPANVIPGDEEIIVKAEKPKGDFCFGNVNINTEGLRTRAWDRYDPKTNMISWGSSVFGGERLAIGRWEPLAPQHFQPVPDYGMGQTHNPLSFPMQEHYMAALGIPHPEPAAPQLAINNPQPETGMAETGRFLPWWNPEGFCQFSQQRSGVISAEIWNWRPETGRMLMPRRRVRIRRRRRRMDAERLKPKPMKLRTEHYLQHRTVFPVAEEKKNTAKREREVIGEQKTGNPTAESRRAQPANQTSRAVEGGRFGSVKTWENRGTIGRLHGLTGNRVAAHASGAAFIREAGRRKGHSAAMVHGGSACMGGETGHRKVQNFGVAARKAAMLHKGRAGQGALRQEAAPQGIWNRDVRNMHHATWQQETSKARTRKRRKSTGAENRAEEVHGEAEPRRKRVRPANARRGEKGHAGPSTAGRAPRPIAYCGEAHARKSLRREVAFVKSGLMVEAKAGGARKRMEEKAAKERRRMEAGARRDPRDGKKGKRRLGLIDLLRMLGRRKRKKSRMWMAISRRE
ncbi:MAG: hypothetical protein AB1657_02740 [Candidatus Micrarchaeota archaeon]